MNRNMMDSLKVHHSGCMRSVHPGVGATPMAWDGFTPAGGGSRPRRDRPTESSKGFFARLSNYGL
jgi:hypothetical protein